MSRNIMKRVIIDSSSLILMYKCGVIPHLLSFCIPVIPETVFSELTVQGHDGVDFFQELCACGRILVCRPGKVEMQNFTGTLHVGEKDVILLYHEGRGDYIVIDDRKGGAYCRDKSIPYINAILAVKIFFMEHIISEEEFKQAWNFLVKNGRYSERIISWAENAGKEALFDFIYHEK